MRDAFIGRIFKFAKNDRNVIFISADMGAPSLDIFRKNLADQFVNVGIAEQNMMTIAAGLALSGKKPYVYAIAPFATSRCYEFIKLEASLMKLPIKIIGVGAGFSYDDSGPTHHTTEDISIIRALPEIEIFSPSDSLSAERCAVLSYKSKKPTYIRLDRKVLPLIHNSGERFEDGFRELKKGKETCIVATGNMVHVALEAARKMAEVGVIELYRLKPIDKSFVSCISKYKRIISAEEHLLAGGLGSIISEIITDNDLNIKLKRVGLDRYVYLYGGRANIQKVCRIDAQSIIRQI